MDYKKLNEKMSKFFDNVTSEELVAQLEELGYKLIEKEQQVKSVDLADVVKPKGTFYCYNKEHGFNHSLCELSQCKNCKELEAKQ